MSGEHTVPSTGSDPAKTPTLKRALGLSMGLVIVVGNVIGSGIFLKPGAIAAEAGQFGLIMSVWLFGGVLCILGALCFAELATMLPRAGGLYVYLRGAYGQPVAFLFGWMELLLSRPAALGALSAAFIGSLTLALDWRISRLTELVLVLILIGGMAWVNIVGVIWGGRVQMVTTLIKGTSLGLMATAPVLLFPFTNVGIELANYASTDYPKILRISVAVRRRTPGGHVGLQRLARHYAPHRRNSKSPTYRPSVPLWWHRHLDPICTSRPILLTTVS